MAAARRVPPARCRPRWIATPSCAPCTSAPPRRPGASSARPTARGSRRRWSGRPTISDRARTLLAGIGLTDPGNSGGLEDASGSPVQFTLLVQKGIAASEKGASFLREAFARVGVAHGRRRARPRHACKATGREGTTTRSITTSTSPTPTRRATWISGCRRAPGTCGIRVSRRPRPSGKRRIDALMTRQAAASGPGRTAADVCRRAADPLPSRCPPSASRRRTCSSHQHPRRPAGARRCCARSSSGTRTRISAPRRPVVPAGRLPV